MILDNSVSHVENNQYGLDFVPHLNTEHFGSPPVQHLNTEPDEALRPIRSESPDVKPSPGGQEHFMDESNNDPLGLLDVNEPKYQVPALDRTLS